MDHKCVPQSHSTAQRRLHVATPRKKTDEEYDDYKMLCFKLEKVMQCFHFFFIFSDLEITTNKDSRSFVNFKKSPKEVSKNDLRNFGYKIKLVDYPVFKSLVFEIFSSEHFSRTNRRRVKSVALTHDPQTDLWQVSHQDDQ